MQGHPPLHAPGQAPAADADGAAKESWVPSARARHPASCLSIVLAPLVAPPEGLMALLCHHCHWIAVRIALVGEKGVPSLSTEALEKRQQHKWPLHHLPR